MTPLRALLLVSLTALFLSGCKKKPAVVQDNPSAPRLVYPRDATVFAKGQADVRGMVNVDAYVLWIARDATTRVGDVVRQHKTVGAAANILSELSHPRSIAASNANVYATFGAENQSGVVGAPIVGGSSMKIASAAAGPIAAHAGHVYWTTLHDIMRSDASLLKAEKLLSVAAPTEPASAGWSLVADSTHLYFDHRDRILRVPLKGGTASVVASGLTYGEVRGLAVHGDFVYATEFGNGKDTGRVLRMAKTGAGAPAVLAEKQKRPWGIAADDFFIYWTTNTAMDGQINRVLHEQGGSPTAIATGQKAPTYITLDTTHIYWANAGDSTIMKAEK